MSEHQATIQWARLTGETFIDSRYSRAHIWKFDGGASVPASSAVSAVPLPYSKAENVDPEEALVAAISSCHMLSFLYLAAKAGMLVDSYEDVAVGHMGQTAKRREAITAVTLSPRVVFSGCRCPTAAEVDRLHHAAHDECYIANSVRTQISIQCDWRYVSAQ